MGAGITSAVPRFLNGGVLPAEVNHTTLVLIPKTRNPQTMEEFRPISLCNVLYKICSKVLALRLREFLDEIISKEQSAFVLGRLITDNVLGAYECIHSACSLVGFSQDLSVNQQCFPLTTNQHQPSLSA